MLFFGLGDLLRCAASLRQWRGADLGGQEIAGFAVRLRHAARLAASHDTTADELNKLQYVPADAAPEAVPALLVEHDVQRPVRLAAVMGAIAGQRVAGFLRDPRTEQLPGDHADIDLSDLAVIGVDIGSRQ